MARITVALVAALTLLLAGCTADLPTGADAFDASTALVAGPAQPAHAAAPAAPLRPLHGKTHGGVLEVIGPPNRCPGTQPMLFVMAGVGQFTHMGRTTIHGSECLPVEITPMSTTADARFTIVAANGDSIQVAYPGAEILMQADPPMMGWRAYPTAVAGFGRFVDVELVDVVWTGWVEDPATFAMSSTVEGWIRY